LRSIFASDGGSVQKKIKALWSDKRTFTKRLIPASLAMAAFCFTFIFFGPIEMVAFSSDFLSYSYKDILGIMALAAIAVFVASSLAISVLKGKIYNYVITLVSAATVGGYVQALAFNGNLGSLNGNAIAWYALKADLIIDLFVWAVIFLVFYGILYLSRNVWKKLVICVSVLLLSMQVAPLVGILAGAYEESEQKVIAKYVFLHDGMYEFSSKENILVFVLDRMDYDFIESALQKDPTFLDGLEGFTGYDNAISKYARTRPALNHILTGSELPAYSVEDTEFFKNSWTEDNKNVLGDLTAQGYSLELYANVQDLFSDQEYVCEYVSNVSTDLGELSHVTLLKKMMILSAYRYSPLCIKPFFWADTNYYNFGAYVNSAVYEINDAKYAPGFAESTATRDGKCFKFYHFNGPHEPYNLNADGTLSDHITSVEEQLIGTMHNLYVAFDALKQQGVYKDAAIIITADHGDALNDHRPVSKATRIGLFYKPAGSDETPLVWSSAPVSTDNILPTIIKETGGNASAYGVALDEVAEDAVVTREYYKSVGEGEQNAMVYKYEITGDASDFDNWVVVDTSPLEHHYY